MNQPAPPALEHDEAVILADWLRQREVVFIHCPNEGARTKGYAAKLQREGVQAGVPDYLILSGPKRRPLTRLQPGIAIELKRTSGSTLRESQKVWLADLNALGWAAFVARGADDAIRQIEDLW